MLKVHAYHQLRKRKVDCVKLINALKLLLSLLDILCHSCKLVSVNFQRSSRETLPQLFPLVHIFISHPQSPHARVNLHVCIIALRVPRHPLRIRAVLSRLAFGLILGRVMSSSSSFTASSLRISMRAVSYQCQHQQGAPRSSRPPSMKQLLARPIRELS
jgi:hypothetical protein